MPKSVTVLDWFVQSDAVATRELYRLHCPLERPGLIDFSGGNLTMWQGGEVTPDLAIDIQPRRPDVRRLSWRKLDQELKQHSFPAGMWDPIHVANVGGNSKRYDGYVADEDQVKGKNIVPLFRPFLEQAQYVLVPKPGTLIIKLKDHAHGNELQAITKHLWLIATEMKWRYCQERLRLADDFTDDPKWILQRGTPNPWVTFVVLHPPSLTRARSGIRSCPGKGRPYARHHRCTECGKAFIANTQAKTCGDRCRSARRHRLKRAG